MFIEKETETVTTTHFSIKLTRKEMVLLITGIGRTSLKSREEAGMTEEESRFFENFYEAIAPAYYKETPNVTI